MDPARGREVWPFKYAKKRSLCIYLAPGKYSPAGEKPPKRRRALPLGYQAALCFVHMLPPVCFALAASSLTLGYSQWIGLALLALGIVFAAFIGRMQMGVIRKIDRRLEDALLVQDPGERERRFQHSEAYKKAYLSGFPAFLSSLFLAISLGSIGSLGDPPFFWALLVSSSLSIGAYFVGRRGEKEKIRRIEEAEEDFLSPQAPPRELRKRYRRVKEAVGRLTNSFLLRAGLLSVLGAAVSFVVLFLVGRLGVSPFVSWWLFLTVILTRVEEAKNALKNIEEERKEEAFVLGFLGGFAHERCTSRPQTREYGLE